jgi:hypothetical protein
MEPNESNLRNLRLAPFVLAALCFFMPFLQCAVAISGIQFATGFQMHSEAIDELNQLRSLDPYSGGPQSPIQRVPGDPKITLALVCALAGVAFGFGKSSRRKLFAAIAGGGGLATLIFTKVIYDNEGARRGEVFEFLSGFYLAAICLLAGAIIAGQQYQRAKKFGTVMAPPPPPPAPLAPPPPPPSCAEIAIVSAKPRTQFYYSDAQAQPKGPFSLDELVVLERSAVLKPETNVIVEGASEWSNWAVIKEKEGKH